MLDFREKQSVWEEVMQWFYSYTSCGSDLLNQVTALKLKSVLATAT